MACQASAAAGQSTAGREKEAPGPRVDYHSPANAPEVN